MYRIPIGVPPSTVSTLVDPAIGYCQFPNAGTLGPLANIVVSNRRLSEK